MVKELSVRELARERERGRRWFQSLDNFARGELGDAFVLGTFDWRDWLSSKPTRAFLDAADDARMAWECE